MAAKKVPIAAGMVERLTGAVQGAIRGARNAWFGPGEPIAPVAPAEVRGRQFDFPVAANLITTPRGEGGESGIDFPTLRSLADPTNGGLDLLRLAIDKRKDEMQAQNWTIRGRDESDGGPRARAIEKALRRPDGVHTWSQWQRMLVEDLLVIDAPTVYLEPGGPLGHVPQVMDGATLKRLIRPDGRVPLPPEPAFEQILKGVPAAEYSLAELVYMPRNLRSHRIYGMSPVEQVVMTVQIALRRQLSQLEYYTAGSVPDVVMGVPDSWSADQIRVFQEYWDALLSGDTAERRRARFIPGGVKPFVLKEGLLKDLFDEWLARIICFCFSLPPSALVKETNRATAETSKEAAQEQGLEPLKGWWKDFVDDVIERGFGAPDLEMVYADEEITNPVDKANVLSIALGRGGGKPWLTADEVREDYGRQPLTPEQKDELSPPPPAPIGPAGPDGKPAEPGTEPAPAKVAKARRSLRPYPP